MCASSILSANLLSQIISCAPTAGLETASEAVQSSYQETQEILRSTETTIQVELGGRSIVELPAGSPASFTEK